MKNLKSYGKQLAIFSITILSITIFFSILQTFNLISPKTTHILSIIIIMLLTLIMGIKEGKKANSKGYLEGLKLGGLLLLLLLLLNTIFYGFNFNLNSFIYYLALLIIIVIGAMIGINKKKK